MPAPVSDEVQKIAAVLDALPDCQYRLTTVAVVALCELHRAARAVNRPFDLVLGEFTATLRETHPMVAGDHERDRAN